MSANSLGSLVVLAGMNTVLVDLLADEGWHCLSVVLETGCGTVRLAGAGEVQGALESEPSVCGLFQVRSLAQRGIAHTGSQELAS